MSALKIILFCIIFVIAALVIWLVPIPGVWGRLLVALIAVGLIILIH